MSVVVFDDEVTTSHNVTSLTYTFFDTNALLLIHPTARFFEDISVWPDGSVRPTTSASARALEERTTADSEPRLPELEITDGLGL